MPENTVAKAHRDSSLTSKSKWVTPVTVSYTHLRAHET